MSVTGVEKVIKSQTVNGTAAVNGRTMDIRTGKRFGVILVIESGTTTKVKLDSQVIASRESDRSIVGLAPNEKGLSWVTVETVIAQLTSGGKAVSFNFPAFKWGRVVVTGIGTNGVNTVVSAYVGIYSE